MIGYAWRTWKRLAFPAILFWILAVCLLATAGRMGWKLREEKNEPCRLTVSAAAGLDLEAVSKLDGVTAVTAVYEISASLTVAGYTGDLTLYGVDSSFVEGTVSSGVLYPESTAMPYLLANEAALLSLKKDGKAAEHVSDVDWLNGEVLLGERTAKLCGIIKDGSENPMVYLGMEAAKDYLIETGETADIRLAWARLRNSGVSESVTVALGRLGYAAEGGSGEERDWTLRETKMQYLALSGLIALLAACALLMEAIRRDWPRSRQEIPGGAVGEIQVLRVLIFLCWGTVAALAILGAGWLADV